MLTASLDDEVCELSTWNETPITWSHPRRCWPWRYACWNLHGYQVPPYSPTYNDTDFASYWSLGENAGYRSEKENHSGRCPSPSIRLDLFGLQRRTRVQETNWLVFVRFGNDNGWMEVQNVGIPPICGLLIWAYPWRYFEILNYHTGSYNWEDTDPKAHEGRFEDWLRTEITVGTY